MPSPRADLVVTGRVLRGATGAAPAGAVAVASGRILAVGSRAEMTALAAPGAEVFEAGGTVLPGFRDAHIHLLALGRQKARVDLHGLDLEGVRAAVRAHAATRPEGAWVEGGGWSLDFLGRLPDAADLAGLSGGRPVLLFSHDFHTALLSVEGLGAVGLIGDGIPVVGEGIDRDPKGLPTGILREAAVFEAGGAAQSAATKADDAAAILEAAGDLLAAGITAVDDMDGGRSLRALASLRRRGGLPLRVRCALREPDLPTFERAGLPPGGDDEGLRIAGLKLFVDGALGSRTAWMHAPYDDPPHGTGLRLHESEALADLVRRAAALGLPSFLHAIGDAAVTAALDALAAAPGLPHRIEHAQCVRKEDVARFAAAKVAASVQPGHMAHDIPVADRAWGKRGARAFPLRELLDAGVPVHLGSDAPVEPANPMLWIHAATERRMPGGTPEGGWHPEQRLTRAEALAAAASHPLEPGAPADLVAYAEDLLAIPPEELLTARPQRTWLGGVEAEIVLAGRGG